MKTSIEPCAFCGAPSTRLCDFMLGFELKCFHRCEPAAAIAAGRLSEYVPSKGLPAYSDDDPSELFTCDAPMCDGCAKQVGTQSIVGEGICEVDSIDHCPLHAGHMDTKHPGFISRLNSEMERRKWKFKIVTEDGE